MPASGASNAEMKSVSGAEWTPDDIPDQTGRVSVVTGSNTGIGFEVARELAAKGGRVVIACRDEKKGQRAVSELERLVGLPCAEHVALDLAQLHSVRRFCSYIHSAYDTLDLLINNAGVATPNYESTADGFELHFGVNHLGHFALTSGLIALLQKSHDGRVVSVSSVGHRTGKVDFDKFGYKPGTSFESLSSYGASKLAILQFTYELQRRLDRVGSSIMAVAAHPGFSKTSMFEADGHQWHLKAAMGLIDRLGLAQTAHGGALPILRAGTDPNAGSGDYFGPGGLFECTGAPVKVKSSRASRDAKAGLRLWEESERLAGIEFSL